MSEAQAEVMYVSSAESPRRCAYVKFSNSGNLGTNYKSVTCVVLPSLGDLKEEYRNFAPLLTAEGYDVICMDLRGMGESDVDFSSYSPLDTGRDVVALIENLQLKEVILIGCSMSAASITYAAADILSTAKLNESVIVKALVFISPFAWDHPMPFGVPCLLSTFLNNVTGAWFWTTYYKSLYTLNPCPVNDLSEHIIKLSKNLSERGRMIALRGHVFGQKAPCAARFPEVNDHNIPVMAVYGSKDPDFPGDDGVAKEISQLKHICKTVKEEFILTVSGAGHYPHVEKPDEVSSAMLSFFNTL